MTRSMRVLWPLVAAWAWGVLPAAAFAQIGSGWEPFQPAKTIQLRGAGARYDNTGGIETFSIAPGDERAEARIHDDHTSGRWQFEGWVNVKPGVEGGCVHQVFKFLMIVAYPNDGGELRQHSYQKLGTTGAYDRWIRINTIHDATARRAEIYIDGVLKGTMTDTASGGPNGWYHTYGIYNSSRTSPVVQWRDVKFWKGIGQAGPPMADAGATLPDTGIDARSEPGDVAVNSADAARTGDSEGRTGNDGGTAVGGRDGSSSTGARLDGSTPPPEDEPASGGMPLSRQEAGCACRLGTGADAGAGQLLGLTMVLAAVSWRVRRRRSGERN